MLKKDKVEFYKSFEKELKAKDFILFGYEGMDVVSLTEIRNKVRETGGKLKVVKNSLLKRYINSAGYGINEAILTGMNAIAIIGEDYSVVGKAIKDAEKAKIKGGLYEQEVVDGAYVEKISSILSREELYSVLVGALSGVVSNLAYVLDEVVKQKQEKEGQ